MPPATAGASAAQARDHLVELLGPLVSEAGYDLEDVSVTAAGRRSVVRVIVDADGGIDLDAVATVSRIISDALDADEQVDALPAYTLEVSSPGIDRPLSHERHWRRAAGRLVTVQAAGRTITGRVQSADAAGVTFAIDGAEGAGGLVERTIGWADLGRGKVQVEFNRSEDD